MTCGQHFAIPAVVGFQDQDYYYTSEFLKVLGYIYLIHWPKMPPLSWIKPAHSTSSKQCALTLTAMGTDVLCITILLLSNNYPFSPGYLREKGYDKERWEEWMVNYEKENCIFGLWISVDIQKYPMK